MHHNAATDNPIPTRIIVLGASNARRGLPYLFETARRLFGPAFEMHAAIGHGRSYGAPSRVLLRRLPGILDCRLWSALDEAQRQQPARRTVALITDIGNDIIYGQPVDQLLQWVETAIERLRAHCEYIAVTALPIASIERVPRWQAKLVQLTMYPGRNLSVDVAIERAGQVDAGIRALAAQLDIALIEPDSNWYGFDPIHVTARRWPEAAARMFSPLAGAEDDKPLFGPARPSLRSRWRLRTAMPAQFHVAGAPLGRRQPVRTVAGSTLSLY